MDKYFQISDEWARQVAFGIWPLIDFETLIILRWERSNVLRVPIMETVIPDFIVLKPGMVPDMPIEVEDINLDWYHDIYNDELTRLGYGPRSNVLAIGPSRMVKNE